MDPIILIYYRLCNKYLPCPSREASLFWAQEVEQGCIFENLPFRRPELKPHPAQFAGGAVVADRFRAPTADLCQGPIHYPNDVGKRDRIWWPRNPIASIWASEGSHEFAFAQFVQDRGQVSGWNVLLRCDFIPAGRSSGGPPSSNLENRTKRIVRLQVNVHSSSVADAATTVCSVSVELQKEGDGFLA